MDKEDVELVTREELIQDITSRMLLHWNYRNLSEIPQEILNNGAHIKEIYFKRNCLTTLPPEIDKLISLTNLYLSGNEISHLPSAIGHLSNLKVLDLTQNFLKTLPSEIGNLKELEQLCLTHNQIETLPKEIRHLNKLKFLELSGNKISNISSKLIEGLESLEELGLDRNPISYLPRNIVNLKNLQYISVCKCNISFLPGQPFTFVVERNAELSMNKSFRLLFDSNPMLNYVPYWIIQYIGKEIDSFGCATTATSFIDSNYSTNKRQNVNIENKSYPLRFDKDLYNIRKESEKKPSSLFELCLRTICDREIVNQIQLQNFMLPLVLEEILYKGPTARCFGCMKSIFTEAWLLTFKLNKSTNQRLDQEGNNQPIFDNHERIGPIGDYRIKLACILFCGVDCFKKFRFIASSRLLSNLEPLKLILDNEVVWNYG